MLYAHNLSTVTATARELRLQYVHRFWYSSYLVVWVISVGSIIAAVLLTLLPEVLRGLSDYRMLIYSIVLIVMMLFNWAPKCIEWRQKMAQKFRKNTKKEAV